MPSPFEHEEDVTSPGSAAAGVRPARRRCALPRPSSDRRRRERRAASARAGTCTCHSTIRRHAAVGEAREPLVAEVRLGRPERSRTPSSTDVGRVLTVSPSSRRIRRSVSSYAPSPKWWKRMRPVAVDQVLRRPVLVRVRPPGREVVVERDRIPHVEPTNGRADVVGHALERELGAVHSDDREARVAIGRVPGLEVGERAQAVDARVRPEVDEHDAPAKVGESERLVASRVDPAPRCPGPRARRLQRLAAGSAPRRRQLCELALRATSSARSAPGRPACIRAPRSPGAPARGRRLPVRSSPTTTPAPCLSACAWRTHDAHAAVRRWLPIAIASSGSACPTAYASVTRTTRHVTSPVAASAATAARTGPAHGTMTRPALTPTTKPLDSRAIGRRVRKRNGRSRIPREALREETRRRGRRA